MSCSACGCFRTLTRNSPASVRCFLTTIIRGSDANDKEDVITANVTGTQSVSCQMNTNKCKTYERFVSILFYSNCRRHPACSCARTLCVLILLRSTDSEQKLISICFCVSFKVFYFMHIQECMSFNLILHILLSRLFDISVQRAELCRCPSPAASHARVSNSHLVWSVCARGLCWKQHSATARDGRYGLKNGSR